MTLNTKTETILWCNTYVAVVQATLTLPKAAQANAPMPGLVADAAVSALRVRVPAKDDNG